MIAYDVRNFDSIPSTIELVDLETFKREVDIVSMHIPLSESTKNLVSNQWIDSFSKNFWFINTSRGGVVNTADLIASLEKGKIIAAGLDVLENEDLNKLNKTEKFNFEKLKNMSNVVLTPHIGGWSFESYEKINEVLVNKLQSIIPHIG
jgi:D-3-phosphoglycerate dehydrogenase